MPNIRELRALTQDISILYVEDDKTLREEMANIFTDLFKSVDLAFDGVDALKLYDSYEKTYGHYYDLVVTDINMPNMNGIELCREIVSRHPDQNIIVVSAHNESDYLFKLINLGITQFILKPVEMKNIVSMLSKSAKTIHADRQEYLERQKIQEDNFNLLVANEELEQQIREEMYNADNNTFILQQYKDAIDKLLLVSKTDPQGVITYANEHFCRISGYSIDELMGASHSIIRHPDNPKTLFENMWTTLKAHKPWHGLIKNRAKNGSAYYVQTSIIPLLDSRGKLIEYIALREDITSNITYQKKLEEHNKRIDAILDNQANIVLLLSTQQNMQKLSHINAKFFQEYDYKNIDDFKTRHQCICELFVKKPGYLTCGKEFSQWTAFLFEDQTTLHKVLMVDKHKEEKIYTIHLKELSLEDQKFYLITLTDITEIENLRLLAEQAEKSKSAFLANMSHEIRTPINGINGFTHLLKNSQLTDKQHHFVDLIDASTKLLIGTINDILDFSKIESNKMELSYTRIDIIEEMEYFIKLFIQKAEEKSIDLQVLFDKEIYPYVSIDPFHLKQILSNLISNALKFTPHGGTIVFSIDKVKENDAMQTLRFSVKDTGIGIPKDRHKAIFDSFTQADSSTTRKFGGTGLGLSISSSLVALMGSSLQVDSEEGKGSSFFFSLDLHKEEVHRIKSAKIDKSEESEEISFDIDVLIVEDYDINQILIKTLLDDYDIRCDIAENGQIAINMSRDKQYDLILMDINMPVMNGIDATRVIKQQDNNPVPIIALTANISDDDLKLGLDAGMSNILIKPIQHKKLLKTLKTYSPEGKIRRAKRTLPDTTADVKSFPFQAAKDALALPEKILIDIVTKFVASTEQLIKQIDGAIQKMDYQTISASGHKMKGSASTLCFPLITEHALALENLQQEALKEAPGHLQAIQTQLDTIKEELEAIQG